MQGSEVKKNWIQKTGDSTAVSDNKVQGRPAGAVAGKMGKDVEGEAGQGTVQPHKGWIFHKDIEDTNKNDKGAEEMTEIPILKSSMSEGKRPGG